MIPELLVGDEIIYSCRVSRQTRKEFRGRIIEDSGKYWVIDLGKYRDTVLKNDFITKEVKLINVKKGVEKMAFHGKIQPPSATYLKGLFERASGNISQAARLCEPPVSDVTMGRWLREAGILPEITQKREKKQMPSPDELRAAWEEGNHAISAVAKKYECSPTLARRWLKEAGIIYQGVTGLETVPKQPEPNPLDTPPTGESNELGKASEDDAGARTTEDLWKSLSYLSQLLTGVNNRLVTLEKTVANNICDPENAADQERIKKLVDFLVAPTQGRIDKLESSVASLAQIVLEKDKTEAPGQSSAKLIMLADLLVLILARI